MTLLCSRNSVGLGEGYDRDIAFASALETFGVGHNDPISVALGAPVMTKFTIAPREIGTYKEVLRSQAREKFLSLRKRTKNDVASVLEEEWHHIRRLILYTINCCLKAYIYYLPYIQELHNARSTFERARFNLINALSIVEAKKRFEFLESVSGTMDAHLRFFKQGYELMHQMEPYINQVLTYAQQSREQSNYEQAALHEKMQEYKRQIDRDSRLGSSGSPNGDDIQTIGRSSHKMIEAVMQSTSNGKVQTIRQGYLSKSSSSYRGDWKRRFFVLDSRGMLYYYRNQGSTPSGFGTHDTMNLLTSTIKVDTEQSDMRFCFRIISPTKNYILQAERSLDQMDWIEEITGVIASLLSSQVPECICLLVL